MNNSIYSYRQPVDYSAFNQPAIPYGGGYGYGGGGGHANSYASYYRPAPYRGRHSGVTNLPKPETWNGLNIGYGAPPASTYVSPPIPKFGSAPAYTNPGAAGPGRGVAGPIQPTRPWWQSQEDFDREQQSRYVNDLMMKGRLPIPYLSPNRPSILY